MKTGPVSNRMAATVTSINWTDKANSAKSKAPTVAQMRGLLLGQAKIHFEINGRLRTFKSVSRHQIRRNNTHPIAVAILNNALNQKGATEAIGQVDDQRQKRGGHHSDSHIAHGREITATAARNL